MTASKSSQRRFWIFSIISSAPKKFGTRLLRLFKLVSFADSKNTHFFTLPAGRVTTAYVLIALVTILIAISTVSVEFRKLDFFHQCYCIFDREKLIFVNLLSRTAIFLPRIVILPIIKYITSQLQRPSNGSSCIIFIAASISFALRSGIFCSATFTELCLVILPTFILFGSLEPLSSFSIS